MGFLQLLGRQERKKDLGVCVPEAHGHSQAKLEEPIAFENAFRVSGVFAVKDSIMIQGKMLQGMIKARQEICFNGKKIKVKELSVSGKTTKKMEQGQHGALFLKTKSLPIIKAEDVLEV